jgi:Pup-ligase protein
MAEQVPSDLGFGNELEFQFHAVSSHGLDSEPVDADLLAVALEEYRIQQLQEHGVAYCGDGTQANPYFDSTGGTTYVDVELLERTTPECRSIDDIEDRIRAHEAFAIGVAKILAKYLGAEIDIHMRNASAYGDLSGSHDNYGVLGGTPTKIYGAMLGFLVTRSIISGAGLVTSGGMYFAQKMVDPYTLESIAGFMPTHGLLEFKFDKHPARSAKEGEWLAEVRSGDHNIARTALRHRIGMGKIALLLSTSPLRSQMSKFTDRYLEPLIPQVSKFNRIPLDASGRLVFDPSADLAAQNQINTSELFLDNLGLFTATPQREELRVIAQKNRDMSSRFRETLRGEADVDVLAGDLDWAAKLLVIRGQMTRDQRKGLERSLYDTRAQALDRRYDLISVSPPPAEGATDPYKVVFGWGYRMRDGKGASVAVIARADAAAQTPPADTRAALRARLLKTGRVVLCQWSMVEVSDGNDEARITLASSRTTEFSEENKANLARLGIDANVI